MIQSFIFNLNSTFPPRGQVTFIQRLFSVSERGTVCVESKKSQGAENEAGHNEERKQATSKSRILQGILVIQNMKDI